MLSMEIKSVATQLERWAAGNPQIGRERLRTVASILEEISQRVLNLEVGLAVPEAQRIDRAAIEAEGVLLLEHYTAAANGARSGGDAA